MLYGKTAHIVYGLGVLFSASPPELEIGDLDVFGATIMACVARLDSVSQDGVVPQGVVSNPVQLTVSNSTRMLLDILHDDSSIWHTVYGYLKYNSTGIPNRLVKLKVNSTEFTRLTDINGYFSLNWCFSPYGNLSTYIIIATFEGDSGTNVTAWANTPEGTPYPACTTVQYAYKPSSNATTLTVDPRAAQLMRMAKSPEEMQKEAPPNGELLIWHEWSWWFPWYRLHYVGKYGGETMMDVGIPIFPWGDTGSFPDTPLRRKTSEWGQKMIWGVIEGFFATEIALWIASNYGPLYFGIVLLGYVIYKLLKLFVSNWYSIEGLWASLWSTFISLAVSAWNGLKDFMPAAWHDLAVGAVNAQSLLFKFLCRLLLIPINIYLLLQTWHRIQTFG